MGSVTFFIDCIPFNTTHQSKKITRRERFTALVDSQKLVQVKRTYESLILPFKPEVPLSGPISLSLVFNFPFLKGHSKTFRQSDRCKYKITKPDCSNLAKTLEDALARMGFLVDDAMVSHLTVQKQYSSTPGILVSITKLQDE